VVENKNLPKGSENPNPPSIWRSPERRRVHRIAIQGKVQILLLQYA
jgi:hypothetical protein